MIERSFLLIQGLNYYRLDDARSMNWYKDARDGGQNQAGGNKIPSAKVPLINATDLVTLMNPI